MPARGPPTHKRTSRRPSKFEKSAWSGSPCWSTDHLFRCEKSIRACPGVPRDVLVRECPRRPQEISHAESCPGVLALRPGVDCGGSGRRVRRRSEHVDRDKGRRWPRPGALRWTRLHGDEPRPQSWRCQQPRGPGPSDQHPAHHRVHAGSRCQPASPAVGCRKRRRAARSRAHLRGQSTTGHDGAHGHDRDRGRRGGSARPAQPVSPLYPPGVRQLRAAHRQGDASLCGRHGLPGRTALPNRRLYHPGPLLGRLRL